MAGGLIALIGFSVALVSAAFAVPAFEPKAGATFHKSPSGQQVPVPYGALLIPIEGFDYQKGSNGWCKWKLINPRGAAVTPSTAWLKYSMTGRQAGQM